MKSLHISMQRVVDAGLFRGIQVGSSLQVSHLFYADDAVFMGHWSEANIDTILRVLDYFLSRFGFTDKHAQKFQSWLPYVSDSIVEREVSLCNNIYLNSFILMKVEVLSIGGRLTSSEICLRAPRAGAEELQYIQLVKIMEGITLFDSKDRWRWSLEGCGEFTVASRERRAHVATNARQSKGKLHGIFSSTSFSPQVEQFWIRAKHINERKDRRVIVQNDASTMRERDNSRVHSEQSESVYDTYLLEKVDRNTTPKSTDMSHRGGEIDQNADAKKCQVSCPLPDPSFDNMTTEFSNQSLNSDSGKGFCECRELKGNSVDTKFAKPSILGKHVLQPPRNQSVVRQPNAFKSERPNFLKPRFPSQVDVNNVLSKPVTPYYLPKVRESVFAKPQHVIAPGLSRNSSKESYG
ncbi:hypothetical protein Tco_0303188 [Tanacetum coccineum]